MSRSQFEILVEDDVLTPAPSDAGEKHVWNPKDGQELLARLLSGKERFVQARHGWDHISKFAMRLKSDPVR